MPEQITIKQKYVIIGAAIVLFIGWLTWYLITYSRIQRAAILLVASKTLTCPKENIQIGPSFQFNDDPSEIPVNGCGKSATILCLDQDPSTNSIKQYFSFDIECWEKRR